MVYCCWGMLGDKAPPPAQDVYVLIPQTCELCKCPKGLCRWGGGKDLEMRLPTGPPAREAGRSESEGDRGGRDAPVRKEPQPRDAGRLPAGRKARGGSCLGASRNDPPCRRLPTA